MKKQKNKQICPVEKAGGLDNKIRRWLQNPQKILKGYIKEGMVVLDVGCGPGLFSVEMAKMVGKSGRVISADLQEGMLQKLKIKIQGTEIEKRIKLHKCEEDKIVVSEKVDFILAFYMVHEVPDQKKFFKEIESILKPKGKVLIVEPKFHVSKKAFEKTIIDAKDIGLKPIEKPKIIFSRTMILEK
ncbi:class I SAM-dependent methyltransferase [Candidatus Parcubacteria bacterium]|nr:class I SAM-dependent methyltransferase [Candidatus Parcubacteria bacterium]